MVTRERGFCLLDVVCALAVITIIATSVLVGERRQLEGVKRSYDELAASRAVASHLEELAGPDVVLLTGTKPFVQQQWNSSDAVEKIDCTRRR